MRRYDRGLFFFGWGLHVLVGAAMILAGLAKVPGSPPPEMIANMNKHGLGDKIALIGWGEMIAAVVMIVPQTAGLGTLAVSGFWGGVICLAMSHGESYGLGAAFLLVTWLGAMLRIPALRPRFRPHDIHNHPNIVPHRPPAD